MNSSNLLGKWSNTRLPWVAFWRFLNTSMDRVFYHTGGLSRRERAELSDYSRPEGSVLVMYPRSWNKQWRMLTALEFAEEQSGSGGEEIDTIVLAGVGSSALGTASLARDVADYQDRPVAGIVSGLGLSDIIAEAWGGWFVFGRMNAMRDYVARVLDFIDFKDHVRDQQTHEAVRAELEKKEIEPECFIFGSPDSTALLYLLARLGDRIKLLVGHSKGNYSIENALEGYHQVLVKAGRPVPPSLRIITISAVLWFGREFTQVKQFIGSMDAFGLANSRFDEDFNFIPNAWHTTNTALPGHVSVAEVLRRARISGGRRAMGLTSGLMESSLKLVIEGNGEKQRLKLLGYRFAKPTRRGVQPKGAGKRKSERPVKSF